MEYNSIYRNFRPKTFDDVIGQQHIVRTLTNQIKTGKIGHAYLFTGTRGTGKTSCAKIFSRAVNCLSPVNGSPCGVCDVCRALKNESGVDILEIDAASNNGVDEIRTLKENVLYRPTVGKYKVYIVDEVHMLSTNAFNALLKTLEEPPEHVVFILATTEVQKIPQTILSRCIRFDFRLIETEELVTLLKKIFDALNVKYDERALVKIAVQGEGSVRDTLSAADTCMSYCGDEIKYEDVLEILGATDFNALDRLAKAILDGDTGTALALADKNLRSGRTTLGRDLTNYLNDLITVKNVSGYKPASMTKDEFAVLAERGKDYSNYRIARVMEIMANAENQLRFATQPRILMEALIVKSCELVTEVNVDGLIGRMSDMEYKLGDLAERGIPTRQTETVVYVEKAPEATQALAKKEEKKEKAEPKADIASLLSGVATKKEDAKLLFEEAELTENEAAEEAIRAGEAAEIWSRVQDRLGDEGEAFLAIVCKDVTDGVTVRGEEFILTTDSDATYERLRKPASVEVLTRLIKEESGGKYSFVCKKKEDKGVSESSALTLNDLFDGRVRFKHS